MDNIELMNVVHACIYLLEELASLILLEPSVCHNVIKELTSTCVLHD